jgi:hypothetical protein
MDLEIADMNILVLMLSRSVQMNRGRKTLGVDI